LTGFFIKMELEIFKFEKKEIRTNIDSNNNVYFCVKDVCEVLGLTNPTKVVENVDIDDLSLIQVIDSLGRKQTANFVNESGLYQIIFQSRKQESKVFKRWVTSEVLPSIRKTGSYSTEIIVPKTFKEALLMLVESEEQKEKMQLQITEMQPKAEFYDQVADSKDYLEMKQVAKVCNFGIGRNNLEVILKIN